MGVIKGGLPVNTLKSIATGARQVMLRDLYDPEEPDFFPELAMTFSHTGEKTMYLEWWEAFPQVRKWVGSRQVQEVFGERISVVTEPYEATYELDRRDLRLDGARALIKRAADLGMALAKDFRLGRQTLALDLINDGANTNETTYDGKALFANDHVQPDGSAADNLLAINRSTASAPTVLEAEAEFIALRRQLQRNRIIRKGGVKVLDDYSMISVIVYSDDVEDAYTQLRDNNLIDDGGTSRENRFKNRFELIRYLGSADDANAVDMILTEPGGPRPVIFSEATPPRGIEFDQSANFKERKIQFGSDADWAIGLGFWQAACRQSDT